MKLEKSYARAVKVYSDYVANHIQEEACSRNKKNTPISKGMEITNEMRVLNASVATLLRMEEPGPF